MVYDTMGNVIATIDGLGSTTQYSYDALYRKTSVTDTTGQKTTMTYDAVGKLVTHTDGNDRTRQFTFDTLDRQTTEQWLDSIRSLHLCITNLHAVSQEGDTDDASYGFQRSGTTCGCCRYCKSDRASNSNLDNRNYLSPECSESGT